LQPRLKDIQQAFEREFAGMTVRETSLYMLLATIEQLVAEIRSRLDETSTFFLRSFHTLKPDWDLINSPTIRNLPAIRWKLMNLGRLQTENPGKEVSDNASRGRSAIVLIWFELEIWQTPSAKSVLPNEG
jgi:hypothetical protein